MSQCNKLTDIVQGKDPIQWFRDIYTVNIFLSPMNYYFFFCRGNEGIEDEKHNILVENEIPAM